MMYKDEAAIAVKVNGKVVREMTPGSVKVPFGSEYSVYFKNLSDRKCVAKITIDGEDVLRGNKLVVNSNQSVDLERYLDSMSKGNKFKFAKMTDSVAENRGVKAEDGVIRIEWQFEKKPEPVVTISSNWWDQNGRVWGQPYYGPSIYYMSNTTDGGVYNTTLGGQARSINSLSGGLSNIKVGATASMSWSDGPVASASCGEAPTSACFASAAIAGPAYESGFTTKGDVSNQKFSYGNIGALEVETYSACFYMVGCDEPVVTTKDKIKCEVCGTMNKFGSKFCSECGTYIAKI